MLIQQPLKHVVVITRHPSQSAELGEVLVQRGLEPCFYPVLGITGPADGGTELERVCTSEWDWLVLTSGNALRNCLKYLNPKEGQRIAVIGKMTAALVEQQGWTVDLIASQGEANSLLSDLSKSVPEGAKVLLPQAANANPALANGLREAGIDVVSPVAYVTSPHRPEVDLPEHHIRAITLASSATVDRFLWAIGPAQRNRLLQRGVQWVAIGRKTYARCLEHGLGPLTMAAEPTAKALAAAVD